MADNKFLDQQGLSTLWSCIGTYYPRARRDLESQYSNSFVPIQREICFVDTQTGLRVKIGDGVTNWANLPYTDEQVLEKIDQVVLNGYYLNGLFYTDSTYTVELPRSINKIYFDKNTKVLYHYDGNQYVSINETLPKATDEVAGIMKLYQNSGDNTDGAMSQKVVTDGVQSISFIVDENDTECLVLDLPWD